MPKKYPDVRQRRVLERSRGRGVGREGDLSSEPAGGLSTLLCPGGWMSQ